MAINNKNKKYLYYAVVSLIIVMIAVCEMFREVIFGNGEHSSAFYEITTRALGGFLCVILIFYCSYQNILKIKLNGLWRAILFTLPCWVIAINNFPIISYFSGNAYIDAPMSAVVIYAFQCLSVGFFEEMAFRGCVFMLALQGRRRSVKDVFWAIVISSAVFGVLHLINIFTSSPIAVILQIGYSFLIGGMCAVVLLKTQNIWHCVLLHAVYNFCGGVVYELGGGETWDTPTVVITVIFSLAVAAYIVVSLLKLNTAELGYMFAEDKKELKESENADL